MKLTILCVTTVERHALPFLESFEELAASLGAECVLAADGPAALARLSPDRPRATRTVAIQSEGFIESALDAAVAACSGDYILRLDDDELPSSAMTRWLAGEEFLASDHWHFPRVHLWPDAHSVLMTTELFPDHQTRLSVRAKSGNRTQMHAASPFAGGSIAPVAIEHHKFLVRSRAERERTAEQWHSGAMLAFSLPEDAYTEPVPIVSAGDGRVPWIPEWTELIRMRAVEMPDQERRPRRFRYLRAILRPRRRPGAPPRTASGR